MTSVRSGGGGPGRSRPLHVITPDEVDAWLVDSMNKAVTYHRTLRAAAFEITAHGVDIERSRVGTFGQGFYTSSVPGIFPGDAEVQVAVRMLRPLLGHLDEVEPQIDALTKQHSPRLGELTPTVARAVRRALLYEGYDGIIVRDAGGDGIDYVIALTGSSVKVVLP